jgi:hypothetical protein
MRMRIQAIDEHLQTLNMPVILTHLEKCVRETLLGREQSIIDEAVPMVLTIMESKIRHNAGSTKNNSAYVYSVTRDRSLRILKQLKREQKCKTH